MNLGPGIKEQASRAVKAKWGKSMGKTLKMFGRGMTVPQIAQRRKLKEGQVWTHLSSAVQLGKMGADVFMDREDVELIREYFIEEDSIETKGAFSYFEEEIDYHELNLVRNEVICEVRSRGVRSPKRLQSVAGIRLVLAQPNAESRAKDAVQWVIAVIRPKKWEELLLLKADCDDDDDWNESCLTQVFTEKHDQYERVLVAGEVRLAQSMVEAYQAAYRWAAELAAQGVKAMVHKDKLKCRVYAMKMADSAWTESKFKKENPDGRGNHERPPLYVGQTSFSAKRRYNRHRGKIKGKTIWGHRHFLTPFSAAHDAEILQLIAEYESEKGGVLSGLPYGKSILHEEGFGLWLKGKGYPVYFA